MFFFFISFFVACWFVHLCCSLFCVGCDPCLLMVVYCLLLLFCVSCVAGSRSLFVVVCRVLSVGAYRLLCIVAVWVCVVCCWLLFVVCCRLLFVVVCCVRLVHV